MDAELAAVCDFLAHHPPFDALPPETLARYARTLDVVYARQGEVVLEVGRKSEHLYVVRSGAVELRDPEGRLIDRLGEGEAFGYPSLLTDAPAARRVTAIEDTLLYRLPALAFHRLRREHAAVDRHFAHAHAERVRAAVEDAPAAAGLTVPVGSLLTRAAVTAPPDLPIRAAAARMRDERVSSLMVCEEDGRRLVGIVTDRDLRTRVLAAGVDPGAPLAEVMTPDPVTATPETLAFEALLTMSARNLHHLPVVEGGRPVGMVTATDLLRLQAANPVYLVGEIAKARSTDHLAAAGRRLPELLRRLVEADARAEDVGRVAATVADALARRLLALAEERLGPPPVPYCWLALGSHARQELTAHSDQDHALLLDDAFRADAHGAYFAALAREVSEGLAAAGFPLCPGDVMATNPRWRMPLARWRETFTGWIEQPRPKALMHASIFFDLRPLHGATELARALHEAVLARARGHSLFLGALAQAAQEHRPPLGFFRRFVLERSGEHADRFDLKLRGVIPVVDLARVYALAAGRPETGTWERLRAAGEAGTLSPRDATNLADALAFIAAIRLRHQARQLREGEPVDNWVKPAALSPFERGHLRDAFSVVATAQEALAQRYSTSLMAG